MGRINTSKLKSGTQQETLSITSCLSFLTSKSISAQSLFLSFTNAPSKMHYSKYRSKYTVVLGYQRDRQKYQNHFCWHRHRRKRKIVEVNEGLGERYQTGTTLQGRCLRTNPEQSEMQVPGMQPKNKRRHKIDI